MSHLTLSKRLTLGLKKRWQKYTFRPHLIIRSHEEFAVKLSIEDTFGQGWYGPKHGDWPELHWIRQHGIKAGDTVIDCGANHGFTTVLFSKFATSSGQVIAVEPIPHNVRVLKKNLQLNQVNNCEVHAVGAGDKDHEIEMNDNPNGTMLSHLFPKGKRVQVPLRTLDSIANGRRINFFKLDVEGYEQFALLGAQEILAQKPNIDIELHVVFYQEKIAELQAIFNLIPMDSYRIFLQIDVDGQIEEWKQPWQEAIAHIATGIVVHMYLLAK